MGCYGCWNTKEGKYKCYQRRGLYPTYKPFNILCSLILVTTCLNSDESPVPSPVLLLRTSSTPHMVGHRCPWAASKSLLAPSWSQTLQEAVGGPSPLSLTCNKDSQALTGEKAKAHQDGSVNRKTESVSSRTRPASWVFQNCLNT